MIVENFLLPRFLILEMVLACHFLQFTRAQLTIHLSTTLIRNKREAGYDKRGALGLKNRLRSNTKRISVEGNTDNEKLSTMVQNSKDNCDNTLCKATGGALYLKKILLSEFKTNYSSISLLKGHADDLVKSNSVCGRSHGALGLKILLESQPKFDQVERDPNSWVQNESVTNSVDCLKTSLSSDSPPTCSVSLSEQPWHHQPLLYHPDGAPLLPLVNSSHGKPLIKLQQGEQVLLVCPGSRVRNKHLDMVAVTCSKDDMVTVNNSRIETDIEELGCTKNPRHMEVLDTGNCGPDNLGSLVQVGFMVGDHLSPQLLVCHQGDTEQTHFAKHTLRGSLLHARPRSKSRPGFREGDLFYSTLSAHTAYKQRHQRKLFLSLFGHLLTDEMLIKGKGLYLTRGHLAPDADFVFRDWVELTYNMINVAPQWQVVNNGNWRAVEEGVRNLASRRGLNLEVVTGTLGVLSLPGEDGDQIELWLGRQSKTKIPLIPAPKYLWKSVADLSSSAGMVLVTLNNPHVSHMTRSLVLCPGDLCETTGWAHALPNRYRLDQGLTFSCSWEQFSRLVPWTENQIVRSNLTLHYL